MLVACQASGGLTYQHCKNTEETRPPSGRLGRAKANKIVPASAEQFFIPLVGSCLFPFAARAMLTEVFGLGPTGIREFMKRRRTGASCVTEEGAATMRHLVTRLSVLLVSRRIVRRRHTRSSLRRTRQRSPPPRRRRGRRGCWCRCSRRVPNSVRPSADWAPTCTSSIRIAACRSSA